MSKYEKLWEYISTIFNNTNDTKIELTFKEIEDCLNFKIDHSFLKYKKELLEYGYIVEKIKLKEQKVIFQKILLYLNTNLNKN